MSEPAELPPKVTPSHGAIRPDAWKMPRAAAFLGISVRTLERLVGARKVPCIEYPPVRLTEGGRGVRPIIVFDPDDLAAYRDKHRVGKSLNHKEE